MSVIVYEPDNLETIKQSIRSAGADSIHVLADFDRTLTYGSIDGIKTPSIISLLRDGNHLSEGYAEKAHALFDKYHPVEIDPETPVEEKKKAMMEWWTSHNALLVESGLEKSDLKDIVESGHVKFREGVSDFLKSLYEKNIPLVILSASGAGDTIEMFFENSGMNYDNIIYVTNQFEWDNDGRAIGIKEPIIHSMNKDETVLENLPEIYARIKDRKNVILLGDGLGDLGMVKGFQYENLLSIGFLNDKVNELELSYREAFNVVLTGDGNFVPVNDLMGELLQ